MRLGAATLTQCKMCPTVVDFDFTPIQDKVRDTKCDIVPYISCAIVLRTKVFLQLSARLGLLLLHVSAGKIFIDISAIP
jgi:hypothetical protein